MRIAISSDEQSGTTRFQVEAPALSYLELLQANDFEVKTVKTKSKPPAMAQVTWQQARTTAEVLPGASELAFLMEARRRGYEVAGRTLSGKYHDSDKRKHRRKHKSLKQG
jgi:hypothetical protein